MNIAIDNVTKVYKGGITGIDKLSLGIGSGVFGLVGRNGAGKTTLMRMLATLLEPTTGNIRIGDWSVTKDGKQIRKELGYLPQDSGIYPNLTAEEFLDYMAQLKGIKVAKERTLQVNRVVEQVGLQAVSKRKMSGYSGGMKRRVGIAQALLGNPGLLIVDEPTAGLDPEERVRFKSVLSQIGNERTVILSTHIVGDIEQICRKLAILHEGKLVYQGGISDLIGHVQGRVRTVTVPESEADHYRNQYYTISTAYTEKGVEIRFITNRQSPVVGESVHATLEDAYLFMINEGWADE
ncbi:ABC transporter ATP-binding protein [Fontibacillus sp. BL9]|uniref:ABC transporter ATP-binding protein n=1 Tax=Fontibacillus sp. BL9 TaxID=3389971 RepID=UPI00397DF457